MSFGVLLKRSPDWYRDFAQILGHFELNGIAQVTDRVRNEEALKRQEQTCWTEEGRARLRRDLV
jgi:hypothetical protein